MARTIAIKLTPKASSDRIGDTRQMPDGTDQLAIYVTAVPENGKANAAMLRLLAKHLNLPPSRLSVIRGATSRNKIVEIS
jgi:uncharacterized protein